LSNREREYIIYGLDPVFYANFWNYRLDVICSTQSINKSLVLHKLKIRVNQSSLPHHLDFGDDYFYRFDQFLEGPFSATLADAGWLAVYTEACVVVIVVVTGGDDVGGILVSMGLYKWLESVAGIRKRAFYVFILECSRAMPQPPGFCKRTQKFLVNTSLILIKNKP
jgi:hypothetical protein